MEDTYKEKLKAKARKLNGLAKRGVGGEMDNAKRMLEDFLIKHKIDICEIDDSVNNRSFSVLNEDDSTILLTIILSVNPFTKPVANNKFVSAKLDSEDYLEVKNKFKYFSKLFRVEKELLKMAFFNKHADFFTADEYSKTKFRDGDKTMNEDLVKVQKDSDKMKNQAEKEFKTQAPSTNFSSEEKDLEIQMIQRRNLTRLERMRQLMLNAMYMKANRTVG